jgi:hypothetical protein
MNPEADNHKQPAALQEARYTEFVGLITRHDQSIRRFAGSCVL